MRIVYRVIPSSLLALVVAMAAFPGILAADDCTWGGGIGSWHSTNWSCGHEPGASDTATVGSGVVTVTSNVTILGLTHTNGTVDGAGDLTVTDAMTWSAGTQAGDGTTTVQPGATLTLNGSTKTLNRDMVNNGTATWSAGTVSQPFGVTFTNGASGSLTATGSNGWGTNGAGAAFDNLGAFNKSAGNVTTMNAVFDNGGTTNVTAGTFRMRGGGSSTGAFTGTGGVVRFGLGSYTLEALSSVTADQVLFDENSTKDVLGTYSANTTTISAGTVNFNGPNLTLPNLSLTYGTLTGSADITVSQSMTWTGGTHDGNGTTTVGPAATLDLSGSARTLNRDMVNNGTATWSAGNVTQPFGVTFTNGASGSLTATGANTWGTSGSGAVFHNQGTFNKAAGNITTVYAAFNNEGTASVTAGTLRMRGGGSSTGVFSGTGGTVRFGLGTHTLEASSSVTADDVLFDETGTKNVLGTYGANTTTISSGPVNFNGPNPTLPNLSLISGTLGGSADVTVSQSMVWTGGTQEGDGSTTIGPAATLDLSGSTKTLNRDMINNGTATWSAGTVPQPFGVTFTNGASASLNILGSNVWGTSGAGGIFHNLGTVTKPTGNATNIYTIYNNDGTTDVTSGEFRMRGGGSSAGAFTGSGGQVRFSGGDHTLEVASSVTAADVRFDEPSTKNVFGSYSVAQTTIGYGIVNLDPSGGMIGSITLTGGTLNPSPRLEIYGDFSKSSGTYTHAGNTLAFVSGGIQNLTLTNTITFDNLEVSPGTVLVETEFPDRATVDGLLINDGVIRKSKPISGGVVTFGLTAVEMDVTQTGSLTSVQVDRIDCAHPDAFGEAWTGRYWGLTPTGGGYELDLTLSHSVAPDTSAEVCRFLAPASPWDCARSSSTATTVTRQSVTELSDWAAGDSRQAGGFFADGFEYRCSPWSVWVPPMDGLRQSSDESSAACGGWFQISTADRLCGRHPVAAVATGRITGSVLDRATGEPVAGVDLVFVLDGILAGRTETDALGRYASPALAEGSYSVMTHGTGDYLHEQWSGVQCWATSDADQGQLVTVTGSAETSGVDFLLESGERLTGAVIDPVTGQGMRGAKVLILSPTGDPITEVMTDAEGRYRTLALPNGSYLVEVGGENGSVAAEAPLTAELSR